MARPARPASAEEQLVEKLRRIEALFARAGSDGEKVAAQRARQRIQARLKEIAAEDRRSSSASPSPTSGRGICSWH